MLKKLTLKFLTSFGKPKPEIINLPVQSIKVRKIDSLEQEKLFEISQAYNEAKEHTLPPIDVMKIGNEYYLFNGQHRLVLRAHNGHQTISAYIMEREDHHNIHLYTEDVQHLLEQLNN